MTAKPPMFDFLRSRGARVSCSFCGHEDWLGWDDRVTLDHAIKSGTRLDAWIAIGGPSIE